MKRVVALALVGVMTMAMVTGCGSSASTEEAAAETETSEETDEAAETEEPAEASGEESEEAGSESDQAYVQEKGTLVVGITDFEPMDYKDEEGNWVGFDADLAKLFAESLGVDVEFVEIDWDNKILELDGQTIDCVWNGMTLTDEVKSAMECSGAYLNNAQIVVLPADQADQYPDEASLADLSFAVESGSAGEAAATELGLTFTPVQSQADALMEVAAGTSDAAVIDSLMAAAMVGEGTSYENLTYLGFGLTTEEYGVGFRTGSDLAAALDAFLDSAYEDGSLQEVADTYGVTAALVAR